MMKAYFTYLITLFSIYSLTVSCESKDIYYEINEESGIFLVYEKGDEFQVLNENSNESTSFTVTAKEFKYKEYRELDGISFGAKNYYEKGEVIFTNKSNCLGKISVSGRKNSKCDIFISFTNCYDELTFFEPQFHESLEINNEQYNDVFVLKSLDSNNSDKSKLYYSNKMGFILVYDTQNETSFNTVKQSDGNSLL